MTHPTVSGAPIGIGAPPVPGKMLVYFGCNGTVEALMYNNQIKKFKICAINLEVIPVA